MIVKLSLMEEIRTTHQMVSFRFAWRNRSRAKSNLDDQDLPPHGLSPPADWRWLRLKVGEKQSLARPPCRAAPRLCWTGPPLRSRHGHQISMVVCAFNLDIASLSLRTRCRQQGNFHCLVTPLYPRVPPGASWTR